jgi:enoyl-CoA hydratase/carnithine racemase
MQPPEKELLIEYPASGVVLARLNRPQARNALNLSLRRTLANFIQTISEDESLNCIVLAGTEKAFCAGADLREYVDASTTEIILRKMHLSWEALTRCPLPLIAAVRGYALGGGCELAMHADIIVAGESAVFGQPEVRIGLMPGGGATQRLPRAIGKAAAMQMLLTGSTMGARDALSSGLVSSVVPDEAVEEEAIKIARNIAGLPRLAVQSIKESVLASLNTPLDSGLVIERRIFQTLFSTADKTEGIRAFLEKRAPNFIGR